MVEIELGPWREGCGLWTTLVIIAPALQIIWGDIIPSYCWLQQYGSFDNWCLTMYIKNAKERDEVFYVPSYLRRELRAERKSWERTGRAKRDLKRDLRETWDEDWERETNFHQTDRLTDICISWAPDSLSFFFWAWWLKRLTHIYIFTTWAHEVVKKR